MASIEQPTGMTDQDALLHRLRNVTHAVLQYDYESDDLVVWFW
jgi:hypothetical protein